MNEEGLLYRIMSWLGGRPLWMLFVNVAIMCAVAAAAAAISGAIESRNTQVHGEPSPPSCEVIRYRLGYDAACAVECRRGEHRWSTPVPCEHMGKQVRREFVP